MLFRYSCAALLLVSAAVCGELPIGGKLSTITVTDLSGTAQNIAIGGEPAAVVIFTSTVCPVSNAYNSRMNRIYQDFQQAGVRFVFVNANFNESASDIQRHVTANGLTYPVFRDVNNRLADQLGASVTPEAFVFDKAGVLQYHGSVDDSQNDARAKEPRLKNAIAAVLAGRTPVKQDTKAFGCTIKKVRSGS